jgi:hypothetical protein
MPEPNASYLRQDRGGAMRAFEQAVGTLEHRRWLAPAVCWVTLLVEPAGACEVVSSPSTGGRAPRR